MASTEDTYIVQPNGRPVILKDPDAELDYMFDWTPYLTDISDTLAGVDFIMDPLDTTLTMVRSAFDSMHATVWVSGGTAPTDANTPNQRSVTCRITTTGGRIDDRSVFLKIVER